MKFDQHVFISYAHIDNQPLSPQQQGWVTRFHATLGALLSMRIGRPAQIWRDDKLRGNDVFAAEIVEQFGHTAMLMSVLTPRYLESEWCTRELREFCEQAEREGGVVRDNKSRVFKVLKGPLDTEAALPGAIRGVLGYDFYVLEDGAPLELDAAYGESFAQNYNRRVGKLAWDAAQLLKQLEGAADPGPGVGPGAAPATPQAVKPTVYLADCSHDRHDLRERLEAELKLHGCTVLPDRQLPLDDETECLRRVGQWLARCDLAIHLVGATSGAVPDGASGESIVAMQNRLAAERSRACALPRLIWLPEGTRSENATQQAFIDALHTDADAQFGADLLSGGIETFRTAIYTTLERLGAAAAAAAAAVTAAATTTATPIPEPGVAPPAVTAASVYLICVEPDRKASLPLRRFLRDHGIDVELPAFEGSAAAVREANAALLANCAAVIVFYGAGDEAWKRSVDSDLKKLKGASARSLPAPAFTYLAEPRSGDKEDLFDMQEPGLIDARSGLPEAALLALLGALRSGRATP